MEVRNLQHADSAVSQGSGLSFSALSPRPYYLSDASTAKMNEPEYRRGIRDALSDIKEGERKLYFQTRGRWGKLFTKLMQERFSVRVIYVSDMTDETKSSYEGGYNQTVIENLNETYGVGEYERIWQEIQDYRKETYQQFLDSRKFD